MTPMRPLRTAIAAGLLLALAGCTATAEIEPPPPPAGVDLAEVDIADEASNGVWYLDGATALQRTVDAVRAAGGVRMAGWIEEALPTEDGTVPGRRIDLEVTGAPSAYRAALAVDGRSLEMIVVDGAAYLRGDEAYAERIGDARFAQGFVCVTADDALVAEWRDVTDPAALLDGVLGAAELGIEEPAEGAATVDLVVGSGGAPVGALTLSAQYAPLPSRLVLGDVSGNASIDFTGWGEVEAVTPPEQVAVACD